MTSFGPFSVTDETLYRDGKPIAIGQRALALLEALAIADGPVDKATLMAAAWPGTIVEEGNLTVQIAALRKALGTRPDGQEWIVTVPRVGYRLLRGDVVGRQPGQGVRIPSVAVLPFQNLSGDPEQEYFADGIVEDIITALSRFKNFAVLSRNSSFVYKGRAVDARVAAVELGARYLLEGSVRRSGDRLRITAQLIDGASGAHLWAHSYDGTVYDVFETQDRITESVVVTIVPKMASEEVARASRERPESIEAYDLYLRGLSLFGQMRPEASAAGIELLERALAIESTFAPSLARLATAIEARITHGWPPLGTDDSERSLGAARKAIGLAPDDADVLARSGSVLLLLGRDYDRGLLTILRAAELNPNDQIVLFYAGLAHLRGGSLDEAAEFFQRTIDLNSQNAAIAMTCLAHTELCRGNDQRALDLAERSLAQLPGYSGAYWLLIAANLRLGRGEQAKRTLAEYRAAIPEATLGRIREAHHSREPWRVDLLIDALKQAGMPE
ncbi:MAG: winged helix-turn-helix domain-containing protein [Devosia sp.]